MDDLENEISDELGAELDAIPETLPPEIPTPDLESAEPDDEGELLPQVVAEEDEIGLPPEIPTPELQDEFDDELGGELDAIPETLPQVVAEEDPYAAEDEAAFIAMEDIEALGKAAETSWKYFSQALEAESFPYKAIAAANFAFQQGFSPTEVAQVSWDAMTDLERLHQPEQQDYTFMAAIQSGIAPQEARAQSNSIEATANQMVGETMLGAANFVPGMPVVRRVAVPFKTMTKWVAKLPATVSVHLPKKLLTSAFSMPEGMFKRVAERHQLIDKAADFFKPHIPNETVFDVYARKLSSLYRDLEKDHIENLIETRRTLVEGLPVQDLFIALRKATDENVRMVGRDSEIATNFNKIVSNIIESVKSDISGSTNVQRIQGLDIKNKVKFNKHHILSPEKIRNLIGDLDGKINYARERGTPEPEKVKMLWQVRKAFDDALKELPGNVEYSSRMDDLYIDRLRLDNFADGFGISKSKRQAVEAAENGQGVATDEFIDDAFKKVNGSKIAGYANEISSPQRSGRQTDYTIDVALKNIEKILEKRPELRKDFYTSRDVLRDLATSEALKKSTIQGSRKVAAFSVMAAGIGEFIGIDKALYMMAGAAGGFVSDTNGREIGEVFIRNFVAESSKAQKFVIRPVSKAHEKGQQLFGDFLDTFAPALATAMTRRYIDGDVSAFDEDLGIFKVDEWPLVEKAINDIRANHKIPTVKRMNQIVDFIHEYRKTGSITLQIGGYGEKTKKKSKVMENLKQFEKGKK